MRSQLTERGDIPRAHRLLESLLQRKSFLPERGDVLAERRPISEPIFAREHELRVREGDGLFVGQLGTNASDGLSLARAKLVEQLLGELALLFQIRPGW